MVVVTAEDMEVVLGKISVFLLFCVINFHSVEYFGLEYIS